jgi:arsenate reductase
MRALKVLFVCIHNSARSQMAEAWLNKLCPEWATAESAGLEPGTLNPLVIEVMKEAGMDISGNQPKAVLDLFKVGRKYDYVITVCDRKAAERCPLFPGVMERLHWSFRDPSQFTGTWEERLAQTRVVRDEIRDAVEAWCAEKCAAPVGA